MVREVEGWSENDDISERIQEYKVEKGIKRDEWREREVEGWRKRDEFGCERFVMEGERNVGERDVAGNGQQ